SRGRLRLRLLRLQNYLESTGRLSNGSSSSSGTSSTITGLAFPFTALPFLNILADSCGASNADLRPGVRIPACGVGTVFSFNMEFQNCFPLPFAALAAPAGAHISAAACSGSVQFPFAAPGIQNSPLLSLACVATGISFLNPLGRCTGSGRPESSGTCDSPRVWNGRGVEGPSSHCSKNGALDGRGVESKSEDLYPSCSASSSPSRSSTLNPFLIACWRCFLDIFCFVTGMGAEGVADGPFRKGLLLANEAFIADTVCPLIPSLEAIDGVLLPSFAAQPL
ncbi:hypothetical protein BDQ17DRAFT_1372474, partial [Cyathus striatus]